LQSNFRQTDTPPNPSGRTDYLLQGFDWKSSGRVKNMAIINLTNHAKN
jgi:hypothetical protein